MSVQTDPAREGRILKYLQDGWTAKEIAHVESLKDDYVSRISMAVARAHGMVKIDADGKRSIIRGTRRNIPNLNAFSAQTKDFRTNLSAFLSAYQDKHGKKGVASDIGLRPKEQHAAMGNGEGRYTHDWTLHQLERLASASGITFGELIRIADNGWNGYSTWFNRKKKA